MKRRSSKWSGGRGTWAVGLVLAGMVAGLAGCDSGSLVAPGETGETPPPGGSGELTIEVTPGSLTLAWIGATAELKASIRDSQGAEVSGTAVTWTSLDSEIAEVSSTGTVTAKAVGTALIVASCASCTLADTAEAQVYQIEAGAFAEAVAQWNANFEKYGDMHWEYEVSEGGWGHNFYDRAAIWYQRGYADRGDYTATTYRDQYVLATPGPGSMAPRNWAGEGLAMHWKRTGDPETYRALFGMCDEMVADWIYSINGSKYINGDHPNAPDNKQWEGRIAERALLAPLIAMEYDIGGKPRSADSWAEAARYALDLILTAQEPDGAWPMQVTERVDAQGRPAQINYMIGIMLDALTRYYEDFEPDPRIPDVVKRSVDYLWTQWNAEEGGFPYYNAADDGGGSPDLNLLFVSAWGFVYEQTGEQKYRDQGDIIFTEGVNRAWISAAGALKQFNQQYRSAHRYIERRGGS